MSLTPSDATLSIAVNNGHSNPLVDAAIKPGSHSIAGLITERLLTNWSYHQREASWKRRMAKTDYEHSDTDKDMPELAPSEQIFVQNLNLAKLTYLSKFVTLAGFYAMQEVGDKRQSLDDIALGSANPKLQLSLGNFSEVPLRDTMARLHHENWYNISALLERPHVYYYEWGEYPAELEEGYTFDKILVDTDCQIISMLDLEDYNSLEKLFIPGPEGQFFHGDITLSVRDYTLNGEHLRLPITAKPPLTTDLKTPFSIKFDPEYLDRWTCQYAYRYHDLTTGFKGGELPARNSLSDKSPEEHFRRGYLAKLALSAVNDLPEKVLDYLRDKGKKIAEIGLDGVKVGKKQVRELTLANGEIISCDSVVFDQLTYAIRRSILQLLTDPSLPSDLKFQESTTLKPELLKSSVPTKKWGRDQVGAWAVILSIGAMSETDYLTLKNSEP